MYTTKSVQSHGGRVEQARLEGSIIRKIHALSGGGGMRRVRQRQGATFSLTSVGGKGLI